MKETYSTQRQLLASCVLTDTLLKDCAEAVLSGFVRVSKTPCLNSVHQTVVGSEASHSSVSYESPVVCMLARLKCIRSVTIVTDFN